MQSSENILSTKNKEKVDEHLLQYVQGNLSDEERNALEKEMIEDEFLNDAVEGLENFDRKDNVQQYVSDLNKQLQKHTAAKKNKKEKRKLQDHSLFIVALCLILVLCILTYYIIQLKA